MQWYMQSCSTTTNLNIKIDFVLPELSTTKIVAWNCHADESAKVIYSMILDRFLLTALGLNLKLSYHVIGENVGPFKESMYPWLIWVRMNLNI